MMKQIVPLESSREIKLARKILSNSEIVGVGMFSRHRVTGAVK